jgi:hypothetical protein
VEGSDLIRGQILSIQKAGELGFEPRMAAFRWHSSRMAFTSQAFETPKFKGKSRFNRIVRMLQSHGQCCPQLAPNGGAEPSGVLLAMLTWTVIRFLGAVPINAATLTWRPDAPPRNWRSIVSKWEPLDTVRFSTEVIASRAF